MEDYYRAKECVQALQILLDRAEELPEYICSSESYPIDKTTVLRDIRLRTFDLVLGEAMDIIEHSIQNHDNIV